MKKQPFSCHPDAEAAVKELINDSRCCSVSNITYDEKKCYGKVGAPSANAEYTLENRPKFDVELDQEKIESAINSELFYVFAVTDCKRDLSAQELVDIYHKRSHVERTWRDIKVSEFFVNAFLVKNSCRARALLTVVSIALFVLKLVLQRIHAFMRE